MTNFAQHQFTTRMFRGRTTLTLIVLAGLAIVAAPLASAQTFMFNRADFVTGTGPAVVAVGDFNGDGRMDVVTGNNDTANTVSVLLGKGDGTFAPHVDYPSGGAPSGIAVGDFNGDGKLDIVVVYGFNDARVAVLLGNGDGTSKSHSSPPSRAFREEVLRSAISMATANSTSPSPTRIWQPRASTSCSATATEPSRLRSPTRLRRIRGWSSWATSTATGSWTWRRPT